MLKVWREKNIFEKISVRLYIFGKTFRVLKRFYLVPSLIVNISTFKLFPHTKFQIIFIFSQLLQIIRTPNIRPHPTLHFYLNIFHSSITITSSFYNCKVSHYFPIHIDCIIWLASELSETLNHYAIFLPLT